MAKIRVGVIFGGCSLEHEVSLQSAKNIVDAIDRQQFDVILLGIDKYGIWHLHDAKDYLLHDNNPVRIALNINARKIALWPGCRQYQFMHTERPYDLIQLDVIFPIVHGTPGEDGSLQGLLRMTNIPYVGSDVLSSAISMDKDIAKRLLRDAGLKVAPFLTFNRTKHAHIQFEEITATLGLPLFIKPANQGSSIGVSKVTDRESFEQALSLAFSFDHKVLVETAIVGRELECAVLGNDEPETSICGEVVLSGGFYSYHTKYCNSARVQVMIPADISQKISDEIRRTALQAFIILNCTGMARVDVFLISDGRVVINEVNTLPGFSNISMYPKLWQASGLSCTNLITRLIELALARSTVRIASMLAGLLPMKGLEALC
ncbi:D-alanine--D-alanine ligase [Sodalis endosymbiont of Henestaris halophilus]|uniref:D-alanine--D-alanine ligase n=1 Tax=Sodalis endosymbiont of Henestaris halophilus TaxID=1929246 RepID=UPI000BC0E0F9|nr:D-alanine--D-alanine ligase [Sodalis endosymbiont of Henestaris halophilus]SNC58644.1 D-alanine--D-alanine ligase A [Sodalis endosymbiont of Henestaris halophilus]